jgi:hypothetical protein
MNIVIWKNYLQYLLEIGKTWTFTYSVTSNITNSLKKKTGEN